MKVTFVVGGRPPKKDGASSMWRKRGDLSNLVALRRAAVAALPEGPIEAASVTLRLRVFAEPIAGDLDNFITGVCDGLMAAHPNTPIDPADWAQVPEAARPAQAIAFRDDGVVNRIEAERCSPGSEGERYVVELEW